VAISRRTGGRSRLTIALLVLTSLALLTLDFRDAAMVQSARRVAGTVFSPLRGVTETASEPFTDAWHGVTDYGDLKDENEELRRQIEELEGQGVLEEDAAEQLAELLEQLDLPWIGDIPTTRARVVSGSPSNFSHTLDINKGSDDGIQEGMAVVNGAGLVGRIVQATSSRSTVQLITDPDFAVGVRLLPSGITGTARGQGRGEDLLVDSSLEIGSEDVPERGASLTTSGLELSAFPESIPVGKVREVREASDGLVLELVVRAMADTEKLSYVTVLLRPVPDA
jgi:rod shape-determining protein MreC